MKRVFLTREERNVINAINQAGPFRYPSPFWTCDLPGRLLWPTALMVMSAIMARLSFCAYGFGVAVKIMAFLLITQIISWFAMFYALIRSRISTAKWYLAWHEYTGLPIQMFILYAEQERADRAKASGVR